jgi:magnesium-transporting ATPase (P-type)
MLIYNSFTNSKEDYEILAEMPFDSTRKRMSLLVRFQGKILMMSKGADSILIPRCTLVTDG